jgi:hypothetical protein
MFGDKTMIGQLISVANVPERNVKLTINAEEVYSQIADPQGAIKASDITEYLIKEETIEGALLYSLEFTMSSPGLGKVSFYRTRSQFDLALLLDMLEATIGDRPRRRI